MPSLRRVQERFAAAIFVPDEAAEVRSAVFALSDVVLEQGRDALEGLAIYRNNLHEGFRRALALEFPVIEQLVGKEYFRLLACEFLAAEPSRSGDLHHIGAPFSAFLRARYARTQYAYFADVAALEWAHCEAFIAEDSGVMDLEALGAISADRYGDLCFSLSASCHLVRSDFPIVRIWQSNQPQVKSAEHIDLASGGDLVLVHRLAAGVEFHVLDAANFVFLEALMVGMTLAAAFIEAQRTDATFDLAATLHRLVAHGVLVQFALAPPASASNTAA